MQNINRSYLRILFESSSACLPEDPEFDLKYSFLHSFL